MKKIKIIKEASYLVRFIYKIDNVVKFNFSLEKLADKQIFALLLDQAIQDLKNNHFLTTFDYTKSGISLKFTAALKEERDMYFSVCEEALIDCNNAIKQHAEIEKLTKKLS